MILIKLTFLFVKMIINCSFYLFRLNPNLYYQLVLNGKI